VLGSSAGLSVAQYTRLGGYNIAQRVHLGSVGGSIAQLIVRWRIRQARSLSSDNPLVSSIYIQ
jgi:hypothetical protein